MRRLRSTIGIPVLVSAAFAAAIAFFPGGCGGGGGSEVEEEQPADVPDTPPGNRGTANCPAGDANHRYISFAGYCWEVRQTAEPEAAGKNYYSSDERDVWVDDQGRLHMKISYRDGKWLCAEVFSQGGFGYGTYIFYMSGDITLLDRNIVIGFFTWDDAAVASGYLSEIDIELTQWGRLIGKQLHYSVQPTHGPDVETGWYEERTESFLVPQGFDRTTHAFTWTADRVSFEGYVGWGYPTGVSLGSWEFTSDNPARRYDSENLSTPTLIPLPSAGTSARISLWLNDTMGEDGLGDPPSNAHELELVIDGFEYRPL